MILRKYVRYQVVTDVDTIDYYNYLAALAAYRRAGTATLYGINLEGEFCTIFSK